VDHVEKMTERPAAPRIARRPRFRIEKLEERIAPKKGGKGTNNCGGTTGNCGDATLACSSY
jgi:hypothetical protein